MSLGSALAWSCRTCYPSGNALDSVLALKGMPGCSKLGSLFLLHQQEAATSAKGCLQPGERAREALHHGALAQGAQNAACTWTNPDFPPQCAFLRPPHALCLSAMLLCFLFSELARLVAGLGP